MIYSRWPAGPVVGHHIGIVITARAESASSTMLLTTAAVLALGAATSVAPACDLTKSGNEFCDDFCNNRCGFYNTSAGETGRPQNITIYRITPANVTGVLNKNTADAPGDITFVISKKNLTRLWLRA